MLTIYAKPGAVIPLGREGENNARRIVFDIKPFEDVYGPGVAQLLAKRTGDPDPYPVAVELDGSNIIWTVNAADTAIPGRYGEVELRYMVGETLAKSERWATTVIDALGEPTETPPEPQQWWVDQVLDAAISANLSADEAKNSEALVHEVNENPPKVIDETWWVWSIKDGGYVDTYISAVGPEGPAGADGYIPQKGIDYWTAEDIAEIDEHIDEKTDPLDQRTAALEKRFADMDYGDGIVISSFGHNAGTREKGAFISSLTLSWSYKNGKVPSTQTLNGAELPVTDRSKAETGLNITMDRSTWPTWTLKATDERNKTVSSSVSNFTFLNGVYYGVMEDGAVINSAAILALTRSLQSSRAISFTANAVANQRIAYALPSSGYGSPVFNVGGFEGGFYKAATIQFTNGSNYTESYDVWLSDELDLGSTTVKVS